MLYLLEVEEIEKDTVAKFMYDRTMMMKLTFFSYDTSFLKRKAVVVHGDVESNPGPATNDTPKRNQGPPCGRKAKKRNFNFNSKKLDMGDDDNNRTMIVHCSNDSINGNRPVGLVNVANDCFFNSVFQALFSLPSFRHHVEDFNTLIPSERNAVQSIKQLFRAMRSNLGHVIQSHNFLMSLNLPGYIEHVQFDAEECMTYMINLFYPRISDVNNPRNNSVPDDSMFLLDGEESILCTNCQKYSNKYFRESLTQIEFSDLGIEYSIQLKIEEMTNTPNGQRMDEPYQCVPCRMSHPNGTDAIQARTLMNLSKYMIIQLKVFGYDQTEQKPYKIIPRLYIEEQITSILLGKLNLCAIIYHIGESPVQGHYVSSVKYGDTWYTYDDSIVTNGVKLDCDPGKDYDNMIPYLLIYEKNSECEMQLTLSTVTSPPNMESMITEKTDNVNFSIGKCMETDEKYEVVNADTTQSSVCAISDKYTEEPSNDKKRATVTERTASEAYIDKKHVTEKCEKLVSLLNRENLLKELDFQRKKVSSAENQKKMKEVAKDGRTAFPSKREIDETDLPSTSRTSKSTKFSDDSKTPETERKFNFKRRSKFTDKNERDRQRKASMLATDEGKEKNRKASQDLLATPEGRMKHQERNKKRMADLLATPDGRMKHQERNKKRMSANRATSSSEREKAFSDVQGMSMVDPSILDTKAFQIIEEEWLRKINEGPEFCCDICLKWCYRCDVVKLSIVKYDQEILEKCYRENHGFIRRNLARDPEWFSRCYNGKQEWICKSCDKYMLLKKMPPRAQANNLELDPVLDEFVDQEGNELYPIELTLISQIIPFMMISAKHTSGVHYGLKGQCVLVPADMKKIQTSLPRACNDDHLISLALKRRLSDSNYVSKQMIRPALVNKALKKLMEVNPLYENIQIDLEWENISQESDPELWGILTNENHRTVSGEVNDSDEENQDIDQNHEKELRDAYVSYPTALQNIDGPSVSANQVLNIAPGEGQIPVYVNTEPNWEALAFPKDFPYGRGHYGDDNREVPITPSQYIHARLQCFDNRFAKNPVYIFSQLDWIERVAIHNSINFMERKAFQSDITAGQVNVASLRGMLTDDIIKASFKNIRGTPQYMYNMRLDVFAKNRNFNVYTFFVTFTPAETHWIEMVQIVARQFGVNLTTEDVEKMTTAERKTWLKRNPVTVVRHTDYKYRIMMGSTVMMSGLNPIGKILNFDSKREFQQKGPEHPHIGIHVVGAPKIDEDDDSVVAQFIDKYITCSIPDQHKYPELNKLVTSVQRHRHTQTCTKKKGVTCRFNAPWPPSDQTRIIRQEHYDKEEEKNSKRILDKVLSEVLAINDDEVSLDQVLHSSGVTEDEYDFALKSMNRKTTILYKRKPNEKWISPYNTVLLSLIKSNMNIQFVTGIYGLLAYLTSYLCKPEHKASELMKKAAKEASGLNLKEKLRKVGNVFITKREVTTPEAIKRSLSLPMRSSNIGCNYIFTGPREKRLRVLKPQHILKTMDSEDPNVYANGIYERYIHRPDSLVTMCYADFAANYVNVNVDDDIEEDDIQNYTIPVSNTSATDTVTENVITLKDGLGKMKKRKQPIVIRYHKLSALKDPEEHFMTMLQLYMPWRVEEDLMRGCVSYQEKFDQVKDSISINIEKHDVFFGKFDMDDEMVLERDQGSESDENTYDDTDDYGMLNPHLLDLDTDCNDTSSSNPTGPILSSTVEDESMPPTVFYDICSQLNEEQQNLFDFMMKHSQQLSLNRRNDLPQPDPFYIFLSGGAGVGKSFLAKAAIYYMKKTLCKPGQNMDEHPAVVVTASTGKAATYIDGTTLHSAFALPVREGLFSNTKLSREKKDHFQRKYNNMEVLVIDEISMIAKDTFNDLNVNMRKIFDEDDRLDLDFGGKSLLVIGDFLQLPAKTMIFEHLSPTDAWYLFKLHELTEVMRQSGDPEFAELLNRVRIGKQTDEDVAAIHELENTDVSIWPENHLRSYMTNHLVNKRNLEVMNTATSTIFTINAVDGRADNHTGAFSYNLSDDLEPGKTGNLKKVLKIWVNARVILTDNLDVDDKLCNGSEGTVKYIHIRTTISSAKHGGTIYVKFDHEKAGNKRKSNALPGELRECVPIVALSKQFSYAPPGGKNRYKNAIRCERKQFPLVLAHAITIHKTQGSTQDHMTGDLNRETRGGKYQCPIMKGLVYTLLSRARKRTTLRILNFDQSYIKHNDKALKEMELMAIDRPFVFDHPLEILKGNKICLNNLRGWQAHIKHFLSNPLFTRHSAVLCFTETRYLGSAVTDISKHQPGWESIHHPHAAHGLSLCYDKSKVKIDVLTIPNHLFASGMELMTALVAIEDEQALIVLLYRPPTTNQQLINLFIEELKQQLEQLDVIKYNTLLLGDFNLDQMHDPYVELLQSICSQFAFTQRSNFSTHIHGGILDLVFHNRKTSPVEWIPSPYSDHFIVIIDV